MNHELHYLLKVSSLLLLASLVTPLNFARAETQTSKSTFPKAQPAVRSEYRPDVGLMIGAAIPEGSYKTAPLLGVEAGFQPYIPFGVGAELNYANIRSSSDQDYSRLTLMARGTYNFGGENNLIKYSYVGAGFGPVFKSSGLAAVALAPLIGFDVPISDSYQEFFSLGAMAKYVLLSNGDPSDLSVNGQMKYWF